MNLTKTLPPHLKSQFVKVQKFLNNYTKRAYLVGGGVRDILMGKSIKDLDIEVYDIDDILFDEIMNKLGSIGVGKSFFVYKFGDIDISLPRTEQKVGIGHKAFEVSICQDEKEASKRRDFTMNAMMLNIFDYKLLDFYGGAKSIERKTISLIDEVSFREDSLRVLRAVQFSARFGFKIDKKTLEIMYILSLKDLSKTRIFWEFEKMFYASNLDFGLFYMYKLDLFEKIFICEAKKTLFLKTALELRRGVKRFKEDLKPYYFLYIVVNLLGLKMQNILKCIDAPRIYIRILKNQPFIQDSVSDKELKIIAIDRPIKEWLGNYKKGIEKRAKELGVWYNAYDGGVKVSDVIADGFEKQEIKKELRRRKIKCINMY